MTEPKKVLVVYPHKIEDGIPAEGHRLSARMKTFMFLSDEKRFVNCLCGMRLSGLIIEEGAHVRYDDFRYFLSRLWTRIPDVMIMSSEQETMLRDALEGIIDQAEDRQKARLLYQQVTSVITTHPTR